jgi:Dynamin family
MSEAAPASFQRRVAPRVDGEERPGALPGELDRIEAVLRAAMGRHSPLLARLRALHRRLASERLQLAVVGQFKRGKSTFINALLGAEVLPTGVVPLTAIATFIAFGATPLVVVRFKDGGGVDELAPRTTEDIRNTLFRFVAEEANAENRLGVERVELFYPADILAEGIVIIDTPGVGSTLQHNRGGKRRRSSTSGSARWSAGCSASGCLTLRINSPARGLPPRSIPRCRARA